MTEPTLLFAGVVVSLIVELIKNKFKLNMAGTMLVVVLLSLVGGGIYTLLIHFGYWQAFVGVLTAAGAFYAFIILNTKKLFSGDNKTE